MVKAKARRAVTKASRHFRKRRPSSVADCPPGKTRAKKKKKGSLRAHAAGSKQGDPCAGYWREIERSTDAIAGSDDPIYRNAVITKTYARLFERRPDMRWFGIAVFGSKQVGCVLRGLKPHIDPSLLETALKFSPPPLQLLGTANEVRRAAATYMFKRLAEGNAAVFHDLYPLGIFYEKHGLSGLKRCKNARSPKVPSSLIRAFERIHEGHTRDGAWRMVRHEQEVTLQHAVYGHKGVKLLLQGNHHLLKLGPVGRVLWAQAEKSVLAASCDEGPTIPFTGSNLADMKQRKKFVRDVTETFNRLYNPHNPHNQRRQIDEAIATLKQSGRPPEAD